ncbi:MAG TPA: hypothetical protein VFW28_07100, partial [Micropepsaceae bacterium]|nr:hypothetical protein [Micropepsaceae bacterium]
MMQQLQSRQQLDRLICETEALAERTSDYRTLINEQQFMIRCMLEFSRLLQADARKSLARADQILDHNS